MPKLMTNSPTELIDRVLKALHPIGMGAASLTLLQPIGKNELVIRPIADMPAELIKAVRSTVRRAAGETTVIKVLNPGQKLQKEDSELVIERGGYRLALVPTMGPGRPTITTVKAATHNSPIIDSAHKASKIFKRGKIPKINYRPIPSMLPVGIAKRSAPYERIVTGVVLEPNVLDGTRVPIDDDNPDGPYTEGDTYDEEEIRKGMYWWMENSAERGYALHHVEQGGIPLTTDDVKLLECWQTRADIKLGDQLVFRGTWCMTNRIMPTPLGEKLWQAILREEIRSWSIGAQAMGAVQEIDDMDSSIRES